ncbi:GTP 3',8-cyclase MoaA [Paraburkholderia sp. GAS199]|uniref:GTP 3',8-cyclase MoaA n=1 Tax=Paraburkholderia sp. GAS199 TaxID=3035126 RepID=UPI003D1DD293
MSLQINNQHDKPARDTLARPLRDLRLSVIDQCNFRCTYCMPKELFNSSYPFLTASDWLSFDQMYAVCAAFTQLSVEKIRLTGGEPLLRKNLEHLIERLSHLTTLDGDPVDIAMTTNGSLLATKARALHEAGLKRITVSLDAINDATFRRMNDVGFSVARVLDGIDEALAVGLTPLKINVVIERGVNEDQILPLVEHFHRLPVDLRFIEYMDVGGAEAWRDSKVVHSGQIIRELKRRYELIPQTASRAGETSNNYKFDGAAGRVGFVSSISKPFCSECSRARVSADGKMYSCLFARDSLDLKPWLDPASSVAQLSAVVQQRWQNRTDRYSERRDEINAKRARIGGKTYPTVRMSLVGG